MNIGFVTCTKLPQLTSSDQHLATLLTKQGCKVVPTVWTNEQIDWESFDCIIIRSIWDYHLHIDRYLRWLSNLEQLSICVLNPTSLLRWNAHKFYLQYFEEQGVPVVPSLYLIERTNPHWETLFQQLGWRDIVVKPAVSASSYQLTRFRFDDNLRATLETVHRQHQQMDLIIQEFQPIVPEQGEWSFIFFNGQFSHSVLKESDSGEFRVQQEYGGTAILKPATLQQIDQAEAVLSHVSPTPLYARVDGIFIANTFHLMELELIEPELFLLNEALKAAFVRAILDRSNF